MMDFTNAMLVSTGPKRSMSPRNTRMSLGGAAEGRRKMSGTGSSEIGNRSVGGAVLQSPRRVLHKKPSDPPQHLTNSENSRASSLLVPASQYAKRNSVTLPNIHRWDSSAAANRRKTRAAGGRALSPMNAQSKEETGIDIRQWLQHDLSKNERRKLREDSPQGRAILEREKRFLERDRDISATLRQQASWWQQAKYMNYRPGWDDPYGRHVRISREFFPIPLLSRSSILSSQSREAPNSRGMLPGNNGSRGCRPSEFSGIGILDDRPSVHDDMPDLVDKHPARDFIRELSTSYYSIYSHKESIQGTFDERVKRAKQSQKYNLLISPKEQESLYAAFETSPTPVADSESQIKKYQAGNIIWEQEFKSELKHDKVTAAIIKGSGVDQPTASRRFKPSGKVVVRKHKDGSRRFKFVPSLR